MKPLTTPERPIGSRSRPVAGAVLLALCVLLLAAGTVLAAYAMLGLPSNDHSGMTALRGWTQFILAAGVPIAAALALLASDQVRTGKRGPRLALVGLGTAFACGAGWALVFFDWSA